MNIDGIGNSSTPQGIRAQRNHAVQTEAKREQQQGEAGAVELAAFLSNLLQHVNEVPSVSETHQSRKKQNDPRSGHLLLQQMENVGKAGPGEKASSVSGANLLSARKSANVDAMQHLFGLEQSGQSPGTRPSPEEVQSPELSDKAINILDRQKRRETDSARIKERSTNPQEQSFLKQNQDAGVKRFKNPTRPKG